MNIVAKLLFNCERCSSRALAQAKLTFNIGTVQLIFTQASVFLHERCCYSALQKVAGESFFHLFYLFLNFCCFILLFTYL